MIAAARRWPRLGIRLLRDVGHIVADRPPNGAARSTRRVVADLRAYVAVLRSLQSGKVVAAAPRAEQLLASHADLWGALLVRAAASSRRGELTEALALLRRLRASADARTLERRERNLAAWLQETDPGWLPTIAGDPVSIEPRSPNVVMHLLKASLPDRQSGYTIRSREILRAQVEAGLEPFVVTPYGYPPATSRRPVPGVELVDGIRHHRLAPGADLGDLSPTDQLSRTASLAADVARTERPAIIQVASGHRGFEYALVAAALRQRFGIPMVYEVRGFLEASWTADEEVARIAGDAELTRRRSATETRVMAAADGITTLASGMRDELVERGVPASKIVVVPNGIDPAAYRPLAPDPALRRRYGLEGRWVFGYVSNMDHFREGHALLIEVTARLLAAGRRVACLLVGDGKLRAQLEAQAAAAGLGSSVIFTGRVPHEAVPAHCALLEAFVVPRLADRASRFVTPLKPYEAMAMGVPLIVSDLPALIEIAAPDARGLAFPVGDAEALGATLARLMDHPGLGPRLASAAREWVVAERTWAANGPRYRELYRSILERSG